MSSASDEASPRTKAPGAKAPSAKAPQALNLRTIMLYALPAIPISALGLPLVVHLPPFYVSATGLNIGLVGLIFMLLRLWDVVTDPVMGWAADRYSIKGSKRRGWIILSVPILMLSAWMIFSPPQDVSAAYLTFWMMLLYIGWTMITISHMSWGAELSPLYHDRSRVHGIREAFLILGMLAVLALPILAEYSSDTEQRPGEAGIQIMGLFIIVLLPLTVLLSTRYVKEQATQSAQMSWRQTLAALRKNKPLRFLLGGDLALSFSAGTVSAMFFFLTLDVFALDRVSSNIMLLCYFATGVLFVPLVLKLAAWVGKHRTQFISSLFSLITLPIILFVPKGDATFAFVAWILLGVNMAAGATLLRAMAADVCDVDEIESGSSRMGMFYALLTMTSKMGYALAIGVTYVILGYIGYKRGENSEAVLLQVKYIYVSVPMLMNVLVMIFMAKYTLDQTAHEENRRILENKRG